MLKPKVKTRPHTKRNKQAAERRNTKNDSESRGTLSGSTLLVDRNQHFYGQGGHGDLSIASRRTKSVSQVKLGELVSRLKTCPASLLGIFSFFIFLIRACCVAVFSGSNFVRQPGNKSSCLCVFRGFYFLIYGGLVQRRIQCPEFAEKFLCGFFAADSVRQNSFQTFSQLIELVGS